MKITAAALVAYLKMRGGSATRADCRAHFKITKPGSSSLDDFAKEVCKKSKGVWTLIDKKVEAPVDQPKKGRGGPRVRLSPEDKEAIGIAAANTVFLQVPTLSEEQALDAARIVGVTRIPKQLAKVIQESFAKTYNLLILEALSERPVLVERQEVTNLEKIPVQDLLKEAFRRPELGQMFDRLFSPWPSFLSMPGTIPIPAVEPEQRETTAEVKKQSLRVLIVALLPSQEQDFKNRPKISANIKSGNLEFEFISQGTKRQLPHAEDIDLVIIFKLMVRHAMMDALALKYGRSKVHICDGITRIEEKVLEAMSPIIRGVKPSHQVEVMARAGE